MELMQAIRGRRAVRSYTARQIPRETILALVDAAIAAPSAMNLQPWSFAIVQDVERLAGMSAAAKRFLLASPLSDLALSSQRAALEDPAFDLFYGAPCLIVICARPPSRQASEDCCLAAQNLMLAAHASGLGSCWIGFARPWLEQPQIRASLGLLPDQIPVVPIIVGEPAMLPKPAARHRPSVIWS
jgi:nitroreductase